MSKSKKIKPYKITLTINPDKNITLEECKDEAKGMITRLQEYIKNKCKNTKNTNFNFRKY